MVTHPSTNQSNFLDPTNVATNCAKPPQLVVFRKVTDPACVVRTSPDIQGVWVAAEAHSLLGQLHSRWEVTSIRCAYYVLISFSHGYSATLAAKLIIRRVELRVELRPVTANQVAVCHLRQNCELMK